MSTCASCGGSGFLVTGGRCSCPAWERAMFVGNAITAVRACADAYGDPDGSLAAALAALGRAMPSVPHPGLRPV